MANRYKSENEQIDQRFRRVASKASTTEMYAAKDDYDKNIEKQREQLADMRDKNSPEYKQLEADIKKQEDRSREMGKESREALGKESHHDKLENLKAENDRLADKMHAAAEKGDSKAYDEARQKYETNIKAQDGLSGWMKQNGIEHENTTTKQNIQKQHLDNDMADKYAKKIAEKESKGKQPTAQEKAQYEKYMKQTRQTEQENLKRYDDKKLEDMKNYGLSEEEINKERKEMEHQRERYR